MSSLEKKMSSLGLYLRGERAPIVNYVLHTIEKKKTWKKKGKK
jgi:hypothetical protein